MKPKIPFLPVRLSVRIFAFIHLPTGSWFRKNEASSKLVGLKLKVSNLDPCLYKVSNREGEAAGVFPTHVDDISGCGVPGVLERTRYSSGRRLGALKTQGNDFAHVGMEFPQKAESSIELTQSEFTHQLEPLDTSPALREARQRPLSDDEKLKRR